MESDKPKLKSQDLLYLLRIFIYLFIYKVINYHLLFSLLLKLNIIESHFPIFLLSLFMNKDKDLG